MRAPPCHPTIHLPALTADEALLLLCVLDRSHDAIWQAHGGQGIERRREGLAALTRQQNETGNEALSA